ncbi:hypothetical protein V1264_008384 [Littorina saxatilis]
MDVKDKGIFLTGGAVGIGRAVLEALLARGAKVLFCDIDKVKGPETEAEMRKQFPSGDVSFVPCDVTNADQLKAAFTQAVTRFGAVELCINNAGLMDEQNWERVIAVNQVAQIRGSLMALEHMRRDRGGRGGVIFNVASINAVYYGVWEFPVYTATKHAMAGFTTSWANSPDSEAHGVRWGVICPHACLTALNAWERDGQVYVKMDEVKARDTTNWLTAKEASYAFFTLLDDNDSNGGLMKIWKENGQVFQELLMMDKSTVPITDLYAKYKKVQPADQ